MSDIDGRYETDTLNKKIPPNGGNGQLKQKI